MEWENAVITKSVDLDDIGSTGGPKRVCPAVSEGVDIDVGRGNRLGNRTQCKLEGGIGVVEVDGGGTQEVVA